MGANIANRTPDQNLIRTILELKKQLREMRTNQNRIFVVPKYTSDPGSPTEGQMWENTTSHVLKIYLNGVIKTVTVS